MTSICDVTRGPSVVGVVTIRPLQPRATTWREIGNEPTWLAHRPYGSGYGRRGVGVASPGVIRQPHIRGTIHRDRMLCPITTIADEFINPDSELAWAKARQDDLCLTS